MLVLQVDKSGDWFKYMVLHSSLKRQYKRVLARMFVASEKIYFSLFCTCAFACDNEVQGESCFHENLMAETLVQREGVLHKSSEI